jgi:hypothetical protein
MRKVVQGPQQLLQPVTVDDHEGYSAAPSWTGLVRKFGKTALQTAESSRRAAPQARIPAQTGSGSVIEMPCPGCSNPRPTRIRQHPPDAPICCQAPDGGGDHPWTIASDAASVRCSYVGYRTAQAAEADQRVR